MKGDQWEAEVVTRERKDSGGSALGAFFLIAVVTVLFFGKAASGGYFYHGEITWLHLPLRVLTSRLLREGCLPLWNHYISGGIPLLGEGQAGVFYPANLLLLLLFPAHLALKWLTVIHYFLAGFFMFLLARQLGAGFWGALAAGVTFELSGLAVTNLSRTDLISIACWLPLLFFLLEKGIRKGVSWPFVLGGLALGLVFLAGVHPYSLIIVLALFLFFLYRLLVSLARGQGSAPALGLRFLLLLSFGFAIGAVQLLPYFEFQSFLRSARQFLPGGALPPSARLCIPVLSTLLFPHLFGNPSAGSYLLSVDYADCCGYLGVFALFLILKALASRKIPERGFLGVLLLLSLLVSLTSFFPHRSVPPLGTGALAASRSSFLYLFAFSGALLTGLGVKAAQAQERGNLGRKTLSLLFVFLLLLGVLYLNRGRIDGFLREWMPRHFSLTRPPEQFSRYFLPSGIRFLVLGLIGSLLLLARERKVLTPLWFGPLAVALILVDLFSFGARYNPVARGEDLLKVPAGARILTQRENSSEGGGLSEGRSPYRVANFRPRFEREMREEGWANGKFTSRLIRLAREEMVGYTGIVYGIENMGDTRSLLLPSEEKESAGLGFLPGERGEYSRLSEGEGGEVRGNLLSGLGYLGTMNVKYILSGEEIFDPRLEPVYEGGAGGPWIYQNREGKARAYVPEERIRVETFREVEARKEKREREGRGKVSVLDYTDRNVKLLVQAEGGSILVVLADTCYPGWVTRVDNEEKTSVRVNGWARGVRVGEGEHEIVFSYRPLSFRVGFWISVGTTALVILSLVLARKAVRRSRRPSFARLRR